MALTTQFDSANATDIWMLVRCNLRACQDIKDGSGAVHWARPFKTQLRSVLVVRYAKPGNYPSQGAVAVHWHCTGNFCLPIHELLSLMLMFQKQPMVQLCYPMSSGKVEVEYNDDHARPSNRRPPHTYLKDPRLPGSWQMTGTTW